MALRFYCFLGLSLLTACSASGSSHSTGTGVSASASHSSGPPAGDGGCGCNPTTEYAWYDGTNPGICLPLPADCEGEGSYPPGESGGGACDCISPPPDAGNIGGTECRETVSCGLTLMPLQ